jgi:hypothetical protein
MNFERNLAENIMCAHIKGGKVHGHQTIKFHSVKVLTTYALINIINILSKMGIPQL